MTHTLQQGISRLGMASAALTFVVVLVFAAPSAQTQTFTVLHNFEAPPDGTNPYAGLVRDAAGNLYGTTVYGGSSGRYGAVFKVTKTGKETVLHSFAGASTDGSLPSGGLFLDAKGNLYGNTEEGGTSRYADGTVFKVSKTGKETLLCSFPGGTDGCYPVGTPVKDKSGNFYGAAAGCGGGYGIVWKVSKKGTESVLHFFEGGSSDGLAPEAGVVMDAKGNLYGLTPYGGAFNDGVLYKLDVSGGGFAVLYTFKGGLDGCYPYGIPAIDAQGNFYGTAYGCGGSYNDGIVWKLSKKGKETVLHNFADGSSDGAHPYAGVILDAKGNLLGDTGEGGASNYGMVYELNTKGMLTVLHSFVGSDGEYPYGGLIQDAEGNLYGTAEAGGGSGYGTVWKLTP